MCVFSSQKSGNGNNWQPFYRRYINGGEGVWGASPQEAKGIKRSQIK